MNEENSVSIAQEVSNHLRIISKNPFADSLRAVSSEWLQLLLVIERIKQDSPASQVLAELVDVAKLVLSHHQIQEYYGENQSDFAFRQDHDWNPRVKPSIRALYALDTLFAALDANRGINGYFALAISHSRSGEQSNPLQHDVVDIETGIIPDILDARRFSWGNLNALRLHYSHELIVKSILFHDQLLSSIDNIISFVDNKNTFEKLRAGSIDEYIRKKISREGDFYQCGVDFLSGRANLVTEINNAILLDNAKKCIFLVRDLPVSIGIPADDEKKEFIINVSGPEVKTENFGYRYGIRNNKSILTVHIDEEDMVNAFNQDLGSEFFSQLNDRLFAKISDKVARVSRQSDNQTLPSWLYNALWNYSEWVANSSRILLLSDKKSYLSANIILRGVRFSHWIWLNATPKKISIEKRLVEYCKIYGSNESTTKQSYEKLRGYAKNKIVNLVYSQVEERLNIRNSLAEDLQRPLNITLVDECRKLCKTLEKYIPHDVKMQKNLQWYFSVAEKIRKRIHDEKVEDTKPKYLRRSDLLECLELYDHTHSEYMRLDSFDPEISAEDLVLLCRESLIR